MNRLPKARGLTIGDPLVVLPAIVLVAGLIGPVRPAPAMHLQVKEPVAMHLQVKSVRRA